MIGPLLRMAASATAARSLKRAASEAATRAFLTLGAGIAAVVGAVCLTSAAFVLLERAIDAASAWAIVGAFWAGLGGVLYFAATRRRRG